MLQSIVGGEAGLFAFAAIFGGGLLGLVLGRLVPKHDLGGGTKPMVETCMGVLSLLAALVLGLLIANAKAKFDTVSGQINQFAGSVTIIDRELRHFGPDAGTHAIFYAGTPRRRSLRPGRHLQVNCRSLPTRSAWHCLKISRQCCAGLRQRMKSSG